ARMATTRAAGGAGWRAGTSWLGRRTCFDSAVLWRSFHFSLAPPRGSDEHASMVERRAFVLGSLAAAASARTGAANAAGSASAVAEGTGIDDLGKFELVLGRPGVVVGVPHGTPDVGTLEIGRILRERLGAGGVFVTGFWSGRTRERINVNRPTEQVIGPESQVLRQWSSERAIAANRRYDALVTQAAQGRVRAFY